MGFLHAAVEGSGRSLRWAAPGRGSGGSGIETSWRMFSILRPESRNLKPGRGGVALITASVAAGLIVTLGGFIFCNTRVLNEKRVRSGSLDHTDPGYNATNATTAVVPDTCSADARAPPAPPQPSRQADHTRRRSAVPPPAGWITPAS
jgi:hypothetical protein